MAEYRYLEASSWLAMSGGRNARGVKGLGSSIGDAIVSPEKMGLWERRKGRGSYEGAPSILKTGGEYLWRAWCRLFVVVEDLRDQIPVLCVRRMCSQEMSSAALVPFFKPCKGMFRDTIISCFVQKTFDQRRCCQIRG